MNRYKQAKLASIFGIIGNMFLLIIKSIVSIISGSKAMLADTMNSASDILSSIMTFIGNKIASKPRDNDHDLGHGKAEYVYSLLISITMFLIAYKVLSTSLIALLKGKTYTFSPWIIIVCLITIITKLFLYFYTNKIAKEHNNILIKANSRDHRNDVILTSLNLASSLCALYNIYVIDSIVGIIISIWIFISSFKIFKESYDILMDKSISNETKEKVLSIIKSHDEIKKVTHFNATPVGYRYQISFTIFVDGNMTTFDSHKIADNLEKEINKKMPEIYLTIIHVNPIIK